ncbi:MAG: tetratricopeptide repeat protein, partial [Candidatus Eremiobacterota bacterium]
MKGWALFLFLALTLPASAAPPPGWDAWAGDMAFRRGDYPGAAAHYQRSLGGRESQEVRYNLGLALARAGKPEAAEQFEKALEGEDLALRARSAYNLGNLQFQQNKLEEAAKSYKLALRYDETDEDARHNLWVVLQKLKSDQGNPPQPQDNQDQQQGKDGEQAQDQNDQRDKQDKDKEQQ